MKSIFMLSPVIQLIIFKGEIGFSYEIKLTNNGATASLKIFIYFEKEAKRNKT